MIDLNSYQKIREELKSFNAQLVAVSKTKPVEAINELKKHGQTIFGENYVQELTEKANLIPDTDWHFIGHLQTNKVRQILPVVKLIHGIDSLKLLKEIDKQAGKNEQKVNCLLQVFISREETKFGMDLIEIENFFESGSHLNYRNIEFKGLMGMATNTEDDELIRAEFRTLKKLFDKLNAYRLSVLSMGMSSDYRIALEEGSNMVRIGSAIFGSRNYK